MKEDQESQRLETSHLDQWFLLRIQILRLGWDIIITITTIPWTGSEWIQLDTINISRWVLASEMLWNRPSIWRVTNKWMVQERPVPTVMDMDLQVFIISHFYRMDIMAMGRWQSLVDHLKMFRLFRVSLIWITDFSCGSFTCLLMVVILNLLQPLLTMLVNLITSRIRWRINYLIHHFHALFEIIIHLRRQHHPLLHLPQD